jgi:hypothetical protein
VLALTKRNPGAAEGITLEDRSPGVVVEILDDDPVR